MKILSINIDEFGCLQGKNIDLSKGFNLIVGENETGKSTLLSFIKFILYGMPRKTQETAAERERSVSMKSGRAAGSLRICLENQKTYTVERVGIMRFGEKRESYSEECKIIDDESGAQVHKGSIPGELFLGVPGAVFESTCFVRQMKTTEMNSDEVGETLSNILLSVDESIDLQKSLEKLDSLRKTLLHKNGKGGSLAVLTDEIDDLTVRLDRAKSDSERIISCVESVDSLKKSAAIRRQELDRLDDTFTAFNSVAIIKRFETLSAHKQKLSSCMEQLREIDRKNMRGGTLPSREISAEADAAAKHYRAALDASNTANEHFEWAKMNKSANKKRYPHLDADSIRNVGGIESVCASLSDMTSKISGRKKIAVAFASIAFLTALGGVAAAVLWAQYIFIAIALCSVSAAMIALCVGLAVGSNKIKAARAALLDRYGLSNDDGVSELRSRLSTVFEDERREKELENAVTVARAASEMRMTDLERAEDDADKIIEEWRASAAEDRYEALCEIARLAREYYALRDEVSGEIEVEKRRVESLKAELEQYNEADLRARIDPTVLDEYSDSAAGELERRRKFCAASLRSISERQIAAERELIRLESESENPARVAVLLDKATQKYAEEKLKYDSAVAAYEALQAASANIRDSITPVIRKKASEYLASFTGGRYTSMGIENGFVPVAAEREGMRARPELLSAGTRDAMYLSLRLALLDVIYKDELPPIALDEALSQMDDRRAKGVLEILSDLCRDGGQCLLFTCHRRESELLGENARIIEL